MIQIGDKIISSELFEMHFICDLKACHGACCVIGDSGAPLTDKESDVLDNEYIRIRKYISNKGRKAINNQGKWIVDSDGDRVTPLIDGKECAYAYFENGIAKCGIEKAFEAGETSLQKPESCHLYPIRVSKVGEYTALNYHHWGICEPARILGKKKQMPVFRFLKDPLVRVYGNDFYDELEEVFKALQNE